MKITLAQIIAKLQSLGTDDVASMAAELSFDDIRALLNTALNTGADYSYRYYVADCYDESVVYNDSQDGAFYQRSYSIDPVTQAVTLGDAQKVVERKGYEPVAQGASFAWDGPATFSADDPALITRSGKIFELGDYPDKSFSLTADEADAAIAGFAPVPLEVEHMRSIFDDRVGRLTRIWRDGTAVMGTVEVPGWVDTAWADHGRKISAAWDRTTKAIRRAGLVINPRVADAALMAAFAGARHNAADLAAMQTIHDLAAGQGATCPTTAAMTATPEEGPIMTLSEQLAAWLKAKPAQFTRAEVLAALDDATVTFAADDPRIVSLTARVAASEQRERLATASAQVTDLLHKGLLTPAQVADFTAALAAPVAESPLATFALSDGSQGNHRDAVLAALKKGVPNGLTEQRVASAAYVLFADPAGSDTAEADLVAETDKATRAQLAQSPQLNKPTAPATNGHH